MKTHSKNLLIGLTLVFAFWGSFIFKPTKHTDELGSKFNLETAIPKHFEDWKVDETIVPLQVDPARLALINKTYNQTLSRTYVNKNGERVMLSIAFGGDMSESMKVHRPEVCYAAQGFQVQDMEIVNINTGYGVITGKRLLAKMYARFEPITYWIVVGNTASLNSLMWKLEQIKYALTGVVADGLLFRVSSLGEKDNAFALQQEFIKILLKSISSESRKRLIGSTTNK